MSIIEIKIEKMEEKLNKKIEKAKNANTSWNKCKVISDLYLFLKKDKKFKEVISELERRIKEKNNDFAIVEKRAMNDLGRVRREILEIIEENNLDRNKHKGKAERFLEWDPFHMLKEDQFNKEPREIVGRIISLMAALSKKKRLLFSKFEDNNSQRNKYFSLRYPESYIAYIEEKTKRENETKYHNSEIFWPIWRRIKFIDRLVRSNQEPYDNMRDLLIRNPDYGASRAWAFGLEFESWDDLEFELERFGDYISDFTHEKIELKDKTIKFDDKKGEIIIEDRYCKLPLHQHEHNLCKIIFDENTELPISWDLIYEEISGEEAPLDDKNESQKQRRSVSDTMRRLNNRIKSDVNTDDNFLSWEKGTITRNF